MPCYLTVVSSQLWLDNKASRQFIQCSVFRDFAYNINCMAEKEFQVQSVGDPQPAQNSKRFLQWNTEEGGGGREHTWKGQTMWRNGNLQWQGPAGERFQQWCSKSEWQRSSCISAGYHLTHNLHTLSHVVKLLSQPVTKYQAAAQWLPSNSLGEVGRRLKNMNKAHGVEIRIVW